MTLREFLHRSLWLAPLGLSLVFVLGVLVFVHELGHFWAAKRVGISLHGEWFCDVECLEQSLAEQIERFLPPGQSPLRPHRMPIGLILLTSGAITEEQLRAGLRAAADGAAWVALTQHVERTLRDMRLRLKSSASSTPIGVASMTKRGS